MYKLLALDLDGTLVSRAGEVPARNRRAVAQLRKRGVIVTIVTGRLYTGTSHVADTLGLDEHLVCSDGAHIRHHPSGEVVDRRHIQGDAALALREALRRQRLATFVMREDDVLLDDRGGMFEGYMSGWTPSVVHVADTLKAPCWQHPHGVAGVVSIGLSDRVTAVRAALDDEALSVTHFDIERLPGVSCLLLRSKHASKGQALADVAQAQGFEMSEVVAVGDWLNDISMLTRAGRSFAMGHAPALVKGAATDQLNQGESVADAIERAWPDHS